MLNYQGGGWLNMVKISKDNFCAIAFFILWPCWVTPSQWKTTRDKMDASDIDCFGAFKQNVVWKLLIEAKGRGLPLQHPTVAELTIAHFHLTGLTSLDNLSRLVEHLSLTCLDRVPQQVRTFIESNTPGRTTFSLWYVVRPRTDWKTMNNSPNMRRPVLWRPVQIRYSGLARWSVFQLPRGQQDALDVLFSWLQLPVFFF